MPQVQYPFIDIAVHPAVRTRFAAGEAIALFSRDMTQVLWANGEGAKLFGYSDIYDLMDIGPDRSGVAFRQLAATARQLETVGDRRSLMMRVTAGFVSQAVSAEVSLVEVRRGEIVVIFSAPVAANTNFNARIAAMLKGFDDPDTHMAVVDDQGAVLAASPGFEALGVLPETTRGLIAAVAKSGEGLIKRPIASAAGYLPAAVGKLSIDPPLNLLFCVETVLGRMDPPQELVEPPAVIVETLPSPDQSIESVEEDVSLPGIDESDDLPVEGLVETFRPSETDSKPAVAETGQTLPPAAEQAEDAEPAPFAAIADAEPQSLQLAADQAEANPEIDAAKPQEHVDAELAEAAVNEDESSDDVEHSPHLDGAPAEDVDAHSTSEQNQPAVIISEQVTELEANEAETTYTPENQSAAEPEDHAEAILNEGKSAEDVENLANLDGASAEDVATHSTSEEDKPAEVISEPATELAADETETAFIPGNESAVEPEDQAEAILNGGENADDVENLANLDGASAEDVAAYPESDADKSFETAPLVGNAIEPMMEFAASEAETASIPANETIAEPEDHAETSLNEGESEPDAQRLAALDGALPADVRDHASNDDDMTPIAEAQPDTTVESRIEDGIEQQAPADTAVGIVTEPVPEPMPVSDTPVFEAATPETVAVISPETQIDSQREAETTADTQPEAETPAAEAEFQFRREGRPVRFVWKLDAQGRFSEVSDEFARTVGPHAGDINGMSYRDLDSLFNLDPNEEISALLERRDTWSGRTIRWPVEGTDLVVPVDLAALPTYSRNREFDGFRGFGIIRVSDAERDPNATGLTLAQPADQQPATDDPVEATPNADDVPLTVDGQFDDLHAQDEPAEFPVVTFSNTQTISTEDVPLEPLDEFQGEVPALKIDSNPLAGFSEKIIQLEERRARNREGLSVSEQNAFREIARQLEPFGKRPNESLLANQDDHHADIEAFFNDEAGQSAQPHTRDDALDDASETASDSLAVASHDDAIVNADNNEQSEELQEAGSADNDTHEVPPDDQTDGPGLTAAAADQIPLAILIHAGDRLIHANGEFRRFSGYDSLEALDAAGGLDALITRKEGPEAGVYMIRADGSHVQVSARLQSVRYESAKLLMLTLTQAEARASAEDTITQDQAAARRLSALQVEAEELRSILETATDGVVVLDTDGRIRSMNKSASALFNFDDSETRGKPFAMLFAHESQKAVQDYLNGLIGHGVASVFNDGREVIGREASGGFLPLFMTMGRMPGSNSYCAVIRDITQWKRSEEELKAAKRAAETANQHKSDFLARVSHEIRTPLNAIIGFSDMIASEHFGPAGHARYVEYANDIGRSGRHVLDIVNDLLDISKIEAGEMDLEFSAVGINDCISEAVSLVQPQANSQRVIIRTSLSQSVPDVVADLRSIKQIAINILANAIRFTPSGGQIVVSTAYEPTGSVALRIRDTGVGMSKADLEQAMKPFGQVSPGARHRGDGTGLGLPLTKAMTEANRALFSIQSSPNEGTLVEITFPPQRVLAD